MLKCNQFQLLISLSSSLPFDPDFLSLARFQSISKSLLTADNTGSSSETGCVTLTRLICVR